MAFPCTPKDWVVDNGPMDGAMASVQFLMYPLGHTRQSAISHGAFIYGKIVPKSEEYPTMEDLAAADEQRVLERCPTATFERLPPAERKRQPGETLLRVGRIHGGYKGPEYSLYIDHPKGVLLLVLMCPEGEDLIHLPALKSIAEDVFFRELFLREESRMTKPS